MISIIQRPETINYSLSLPEIIFNSDKPFAKLEIKLAGSSILQERYDTAPNFIPTKINLRKLLNHLIINNIPKEHSSVTLHEDAVKTFQVSLVDEDEIPEVIEFKLLIGFNKFRPTDYSAFFINNWLNLCPDVLEVYFHQPLFFTAYPDRIISIKAKAIKSDGTSKVETLGTFVANKLQSVNVNPGKLQQIFGSEFSSVEIYAVDVYNKLALPSKKLMYKGLYPFLSDIFVYQNRLSGWDTLVLCGEQKRTHNNIPSIAVNDEVEFQYDTLRNQEFEKTTGYMETTSQYNQFIDFLLSSSKFYLYEGRLIEIIATENKLTHTKGSLNSYTFRFQPANKLEFYPEIGTLTSNILIS